MLIYELNSNTPVVGDSQSTAERVNYKSVRKPRKASTRVKTVKSVRGRKKSVEKTKPPERRTIKGGKIKKLKKKNINLLKKLSIRVKKR